MGIKIDKISGKPVLHEHDSDDILNDSTVTGTTLTDALNNLLSLSNIPDNWLDNIPAIRGEILYQDEDDIGESLTLTEWEFDSASASQDDGTTVLKPTDIVITLDVDLDETDTSLQVNDGTGLSAIQTVIGAGKSGIQIATEMKVLIDNLALALIVTRIGQTLEIENSTPNNLVAINLPVASNIVDGTTTGRWIYLFTLVGTIATQTLSNKTINNTNIIISAGSNGLVKVTAGVPSVAINGTDYNDGTTSLLSDWNTVTLATISGAGSTTACATATITGCTYLDALKWNRGLFRCRKIAIGVTVDNTTDKITDNGHGKLTGDVVYFAAASMPAGLTANRPYFIIYDAANTYKVADTPTLATAGTAINITSDGTTVTAAYLIHGYVDSATESGGTLTLSLSLDTNLSTTVSDQTNYQITRIRKIYDFQEYIYTGVVELTVDASNAQGRRILDIKQPMYLQSVNSAVGTAAGTTLTWNVYSGTSGINPNTVTHFAANQDMGTNTTLNYRRPTNTTTPKLLASGTNIGIRITSMTGTAGAFLQKQLFLVPIDIIVSL